MTGQRWLTEHQAQPTDDGGDGGQTPAQRETGELLIDRSSASEYYIGRYSATADTYTITRVRFSPGKVIKDQATGSWEARLTLPYTG